MPFAYQHEGTRFPAGRCVQCGLVFLTMQPAPGELPRLYSSEYFREDYRCGHADRSAFAGEESQRGDDRLFALIGRHARGGDLVELGPAGGDFLVAARARGYAVVGVEISADAAQSARDRFGLDVRAGSLREAGLADRSADIFYMGDVLEHVPDPAATLREGRRVLRPDGLLVIAGPTTINSLARRAGLALYRALRRTKILRMPPYHLWEFTPSTLRGLVEQTGFEVVAGQADKIPPAAGSTSAGPDRWVQWVCDLVNVPLTRVTQRWGDRYILVARSRPA